MTQSPRYAVIIHQFYTGGFDTLFCLILIDNWKSASFRRVVVLSAFSNCLKPLTFLTLQISIHIIAKVLFSGIFLFFLSISIHVHQNIYIYSLFITFYYSYFVFYFVICIHLWEVLGNTFSDI